MHAAAKMDGTRWMGSQSISLCTMIATMKEQTHTLDLGSYGGVGEGDWMLMDEL